jgi:hypothetical protein
MLREVEDDGAGWKNWALQFSEMVFLDEFSEWLAHWPVSRSPSHTHREKAVHLIFWFNRTHVLCAYVWSKRSGKPRRAASGIEESLSRRLDFADRRLVRGLVSLYLK